MIRPLLKKSLDLILPPRCPLDGSIVDRAGAISPASWKNLTFIADPKCQKCGVPFTIEGLSITDMPQDLMCADCLSNTHVFDTARSALVYDEFSRPLILAFKHGDALHLHITLTALMQNVTEDVLDENMVIIPVPLHRFRFLKRRYNQAAILAQSLSKKLDLTYLPDTLQRHRNTPTQGHQSAKDRHKNVKGAFHIPSDKIEHIAGKNILLIDDVFTTGATLDECTKTLKENGAKKVNVLTLARAVKQ